MTDGDSFFKLWSFYIGIFRKCQQHDYIFINVVFPSHLLLLLVIMTCYLLSLTVQSINICIECHTIGLVNDWIPEHCYSTILARSTIVLVFTKYYKLDMEIIDFIIMTSSQSS